MIENVTLGDMGDFIKFLVALIGGCIALYAYMKKFIGKIQKESLQPMHDDLHKLQSSVDEVAKENAHNYIVHFQAMADKRMPFSADELQRYYENLTIYERLGGNGYIHATHDRLKREDKLEPTYK